MTLPHLYMDEDSMDQVLVRTLREHSVDVRTALDDQMLGSTDEAQLLWATQKGRSLYTYNIRDFARLHAAFLARGETHGGLIFVQQGRFTVGEQVRGVLALLGGRSAEQLAGVVEFLASWVTRSTR
jgi:hypothetical protein